MNHYGIGFIVGLPTWARPYAPIISRKLHIPIQIADKMEEHRNATSSKHVSVVECIASLGLTVQVVVGVPLAWGASIRDLDSWGPIFGSRGGILDLILDVLVQ